MLRRALSQQAPVREALYEGILQVGPSVAAAKTLPPSAHVHTCLAALIM